MNPDRDTGDLTRREAEILRRCALRFDGRRYIRETGFDAARALDAYMATGEFPAEEAEQWALFSALHRSLLGWGREDTPRDGREWFVFRALFLELCGRTVPLAYRLSPYYEEWQRDWEPRLPELLATIKDIHEHTYYRDDALPPM